jgi:S-adenosylmethionine hydrolase
MPIVTLLTDFGTQDEYVAVLKGVIYSINPAVYIVDVSHRVPSQDIIHAAHILSFAFDYFPEGTVHLAIVDPGVGSDRAIIAARQAGQIVIAPDNGLCSLVWEKFPPDLMVRVENPVYFRHPISRTFHGRDIMSPVAAHLCSGAGLTDIGSIMQLDQAKVFQIPKPVRINADTWQGQIVYTDKFGNLVTNVDSGRLSELGPDRTGSIIELACGDVRVRGLAENYSQVKTGQPLLIIGSRDYLEIAVNQASAAHQLGIGPGASFLLSRTSGHKYYGEH